jgi:hypothetical protein
MAAMTWAVVERLTSAVQGLFPLVVAGHRRAAADTQDPRLHRPTPDEP